MESFTRGRHLAQLAVFKVSSKSHTETIYAFVFYLNHKIRLWQSPFLTRNILLVIQGWLFVFSVSEKLLFWVCAEAWLGPKGAAPCLVHAQAWSGFRNGVPWQTSFEEHRQKAFSWTRCRCFPLLPQLF